MRFERRRERRQGDDLCAMAAMVSDGIDFVRGTDVADRGSVSSLRANADGQPGALEGGTCARWSYKPHPVRTRSPRRRPPGEPP